MSCTVPPTSPFAPSGSPPAAGGRGNRRLLPLAAAALGILALLLLAGLAARSGSYVTERPAGPTTAPATYTPPPASLPTAELTASATTPPPPATVAAGWVALAGGLLVLLGLLAGVALLATLLPRWRLSRRGRPVPAALGAAGEPTAELPAAVDRALEAVEQPDAREAVVRAWLLLGEAAAAAGTPARTSETATEYAERLAGAHRLPAASVHRLAELYREARFSGHPVRAEQRDRARAELQQLRGALSPAVSP